MFDKNFDTRMAQWREFRLSLEEAEDPIQDTINFYNNAPLVSIHTDPYTKETWPGPWILLQENCYCDFAKLLGICYSLQLTERFSLSLFEIHITHDREKSETNYLLFVDDVCIGYEFDRAVPSNQLPASMQVKMRHSMPPLQ